MILQNNIYNILRCGGFLVKYTDGSGLSIKPNNKYKSPVTGQYTDTETHRSIYMKPKDIKVGEPGFVYTKVWKDWERHTKESVLPVGGLESQTLLGYLESILALCNRDAQKEAMIATKDKVRDMKHFIGERTIHRKRNGVWVEIKVGNNIVPTYLGITVKTLTYGIAANNTKYTIEECLYNDFGYNTAPVSTKTFAPSQVPRGYKFKALYNDGYIPADKKYSESITYKIAGTSHSVVADPSISDSLLPRHNELARKVYQYSRAADLSGLRGQHSIGADDYLLFYKRLELAAVRNVSWYDDEDTSASWWTMSEQMIDYWYYQRPTTELIYRATKQLVIPVDAGVGDSWGFEDAEQVGHTEVFDRAVKMNIDAPKDTSILNLLRAIVPEIIDDGVLSGLLGGYKFTTKESAYKTGIQSRVFGKVDGLLKHPINKSIYKVPRAKALGFKPVTRVVRGVSRQYINLKDLGLTKGNEFVCLDETRGHGFSDFKQLWIMYKVYLLLSGDLRKLTKEQKTLLNVTGIDGKTAQKLKDKIQARKDSLDYLEHKQTAIGGMPEFMPSDTEVKRALRHHTRLESTIKMLAKCSLVTEYPTTMTQMFNMVHTGKRLAVGDKVDTEFVGTPRPRSAGLRCIVPDRDLTHWDGSKPIYVKAYCKSYKCGMKPLKASKPRFNVNPITYLEVTPISDSTLEHLKWEPIYSHFPVQPVVKTTSISWIYLDDPIADIEESIDSLIRKFAATVKKFKLNVPIRKHLHNGYEVQQANTGHPHQKQLEDWLALREWLIEQYETRRGDV